MKRLQKLLSSTMAITLAVTCALPVSASAAKSFSDVKGHWAADYIKSGVNRGYVNGYENGSFNPNGPVSRAEFCKMINNAIGLKGTTSIQFKDVSSNDWFYNEVSKAVASGYITGYDDGSFRAKDKITRQEAAVVISRIISNANGKDVSELKDAGSIASWAMSGANAVYSKGYMGGDNQKKFNPNGYLTRGEAVKIVEGILDGEDIASTDSYLSTSNQSAYNKVFTGNVTISANGNTTLQNCRVLGTLNVTGESTVRLQDTMVNKLAVNVSSGKTEITASGSSEVRQADLATGATLTENGIYGKGFEKVTLSGTKLSSQDVTLNGVFTEVNLNATSNLTLRSGTISNFRLASNASGSKINLLSGTRVESAELNGRGDFTGTGIIQYATLKNTGSTFETQPLRMDGNTALMPTISPKNGASGVSVSQNISLTFNEIPYTSSNSVVTTSYVEGSVIELRRDSESGSKVSFDASLSSNNRVMTIDPSSDLSSGTRYYVIVKPTLRNSRGDTNDRMVFNFTTENGLTPTVYPADGSSSIPVSTALRLEFGESVYQPNGNSLSNSYLNNTALELRTNSKSGRLVSISPSISSDRKTITISTDGNLATNTTYYLIVKGGTIANYNRDTLSEQVYSFTTASSSTLVPSMTPSPGSTKVSTGTDLVLDFDTTIYTASGGTMSASYLEDSVFTLRRDSASGSATSFQASINSSKTSVTLTPESTLRANTTYYLVMSDGSLSNGSSSNRRYNDRLVLSFTTGTSDTQGDLAPTPNPANGETGVSVDSDITLTFDSAIYRAGSSSSSISSTYLENEVLELRSGSSSGSTVNFSADMTTSRKITITPSRSLSNNTRYYVIVKSGSIQNSSGLRNSKFTSYFTCGSTAALLSPSISPEDGSSGVSPTTNITISFGEDIYDNSNSRLTNNSASYTYVTKYGVELRVGSESGNLVPFSTTSISSNRRITIAPNSSLNNGSTYYVILKEGYFRNSAGQSNKRQVYRFTVGSGLTTSTSPSNGQTGVSRSSSIVLYFNESITDTYGNSITNSYVKSNLSISPSIDYTASLSNSSRTLTITPQNALEANRTYTVSLPANRVLGSSGYRNSAISFSFTTNSTALVPTVSPASGSTNVSPNPTITLAFGETLYNPNMGLLTDGDVKNAIELRQGGTNGTLTNYTASVSGNRTITLTPSSTLERGTSYYVILKGSSIANSSRLLNSYQYFYFTTQVPTNIPAPSMSFGGVRPNGTQDVTITFSTAVYQVDKTPISDVYLRNNFKLKAGGVELTPTNASISSDYRTITLSYPTPLAPGTSYTLSAAANVLSDSSGNKNLAINLTQSTPAPVVNLIQKSLGKTSASIQVDYDYPLTFTVSGTRTDPNGSGNPPILSSSGILTPNDASGSFDLALTGLSEGTSYTVIVEYTYGAQSTPVRKTINVTTEVTSTVSTLSGLRVKDAEFTHHIPLIASASDVTVTPGSVTIYPTASAGSKATITVNEEVVSSGASKVITVTDSPVIVTIVVTAEDNKSTTTYTLNLIPRVQPTDPNPPQVTNP